MKATSIAFEQYYSDGSGVVFGVRLKQSTLGPVIEFESVNTIDFPAEEIDWLIQCLQRIKTELDGSAEGGER